LASPLLAPVPLALGCESNEVRVTGGIMALAEPKAER
jgi:hypothetical protein